MGEKHILTIERQATKIQRLQGILKIVEWLPKELGGQTCWICPICDMIQESGHETDCSLRAALG